MVRIYFNEACSKCNAAFCALEERGIDFETVHYLQQIPDETTLRNLLKKLGLPAIDMMRKSEPLFQEKFSNRTLTEEECIQAMVQYPILIQRPIVEFEDIAYIVRPPLTVVEILNKLKI